MGVLGSRARVKPGHGSGTQLWGAQWELYGSRGGRHGSLGSLSAASGKGDNSGEEWEGKAGLGEALMEESVRSGDCPTVNAALRHLLGHWRC